MRIAVAGGTGVVGRYVVGELEAAGHEPVVLTRSRGVDLVSGRGLEAVADVSAVIDVSNVVTTNRARSTAFFEATTRSLLATGTPLVALSIVGVDRVDLGYYAGKLRQEELVLGGGGTVLRATQFHEFAEQMAARARGPVAVAPRMRSQPVAAREAAQALVALALAAPAGRVPDLAGPEVLEVPDMVRALLRARGSRRLVLPLRVPGAAGRAMASGGLLPTEEGPRGSQTFAQWLEQRT